MAWPEKNEGQTGLTGHGAKAPCFNMQRESHGCPGVRGASRRAASTGNTAHSLAGQCWHWENAKCAAANDLSADSTAPAGRGEGQSMGRGDRDTAQPGTGTGTQPGPHQGTLSS